MHHATAKRLAHYFDYPPSEDYLVPPGPFNAGVLACSIERSPAYEAIMGAIGVALMAAEQKAADRTRRADVERQQGALNIAEDHLETTHEVWIESMTSTVRRAPRVLENLQPTMLPHPNSGRPPETRAAYARKVREFKPQDFSIDPIKMLTKEQRDDKVGRYRLLMAMCCEEADWDEDLRILWAKFGDHLMKMVERIGNRVNTEMEAVVKEINDLARSSIKDEIPLQRWDSLERRLRGMRVQRRHLDLMYHAFRLEREVVVMKSGIRSWEHQTLAQRAEYFRGDKGSKKAQREANVQHLENLSDKDYYATMNRPVPYQREFRQGLREREKYAPKASGIEFVEDEPQTDLGEWWEED